MPILAGDARILSAARIEARSRFDSNRSLEPGSPDVKQRVSEAEEVARILRQNIVQGEPLAGTKNGDQRYRASSLPQSIWAFFQLNKVGAARVWKIVLTIWGCAELRIHKDIERGDNASIKTGSVLTAAGGSCCGEATR